MFDVCRRQYFNVFIECFVTFYSEDVMIYLLNSHCDMFIGDFYLNRRLCFNMTMFSDIYSEVALLDEILLFMCIYMILSQYKVCNLLSCYKFLYN